MLPAYRRSYGGVGMLSGVRPTASTARPVAGAVFAVVAVSVLAPDPPRDVVVWLATTFPLAVAGFAIWRLNVPVSYGSMDRVRLRAHVAGNTALLAVCGSTAYVSAILLPPGSALAVAAGFACAIILVAVRLWLVIRARRRFTVWRQ